MSPLDGLGPTRHNPYLTAGIDTGAAPAQALDKAGRAAREFESVFLSTIFERMFASLETDGLFGGGEAEKTWRSFLTEQYANEVTAQGGIGLADAVRSELIALQEASQQ